LKVIVVIQRTLMLRMRECSIFNSASVRASLKLKYKPKIVDGKPTPVENVKHRFTFKLDG